MQRLVVTSCGTSLLTNGADPDIRRLLSDRANASERDLAAAEREQIEARIEAVRQALLEVEVTAARKMSAELNGLLGLYDGTLQPQACRDMQYLLCTDTYLGRRSADLVAEWLRLRDVPAAVFPIEGLTARNSTDFRWGVTELVKWCEEVLAPQGPAYHVIFNIVGGFKALVGALTTLGMFYADELAYIFESGDGLVRIPRLPVRLEAEEVVGRHLTLFRRMSLGLPAPARLITGVAETLLDSGPEGVTLSAWGQLVWERSRQQLYAPQLLEPPLERIRYGPGFARSVAGYAGGDRMVLINHGIDQLARYVLTNGAENPPSLDFKALKGKPSPPSTHEMDAWHDRDARRIFCHLEQDIIVLDRLGEGLH